MSGHHQGPCDEGIIRAQGSRPFVAPPLIKKRASQALAAAVLGSSMAFIDGSVVNIALPAIQRDFGGSGVSLADMQWVINACLLALSALLLVGGSLGDRFGRRTIFIIGTWAVWAAITGAAGPVVGGWLVDAVSWRAIFLINVPLAGAAGRAGQQGPRWTAAG